MAPVEPRTARMDQLTKPSVKASIEAAAFVVMAAYACAQELLKSRQQTVGNQSDHQALLAALEEPSTPHSLQGAGAAGSGGFDDDQ